MKHRHLTEGNRSGESPPARGRGLKLEYYVLYQRDAGSPPARGRGLKRGDGVSIIRRSGRPPRGGVD